MASSHFMDVPLPTPEDDDRIVVVEFTATGGCAAHMGSLHYPGHPAEGPEIEIVSAWLKADENTAGAPSYAWTDDEAQRIEQHIAENFEDPGPDPDDAYDARIDEER